MKQIMKSMSWTLFIVFLLITVGCQKNDDTEIPGENQGSLQVAVTDAPSDDKNIEAAVMTFTAVEMDGQVHTFPKPVTVNVAALTEGMTKILVDQAVEAKSYQNLALIVDYDQDADGNTPGCYVMTKDKVKHNLKASANASSKILVNSGTYTVPKDGFIKAVIDIDLRKCIRYEGDQQDTYTFSNNLSAATRLSWNDEGLSIQGTVKDNLGFGDDKLIVYAYKKGSFNADTETEIQGQGDVMFEGAVTSCAVKGDGSFSLHFLAEGEYELICVSYTENTEGKFIAEAFLTTNPIGTLELFGLSLAADLDVTLNIFGKVDI